MTTQANIVISGRDDTRAAFASASRNMRDLGDKTSGLVDRLGSIGNALRGISLIGNLANTALAAMVHRSIEGVAQFQDLSEKIGDTSTNVAGLKLAADVSGTSLDTVAAASVRLTAGLSKTDDESKGVGAAIKALGLEFDQFKKLSPVEQLDAVAQAMAGFKDGAGKTAVAVALFGKAGAELIPFLNDLAENGRTQIKLSGEQIRAADDYTKSVARLRNELGAIGQETAAGLVPTMAELVSLLRETARYASDAGTGVSVLQVALDGLKKVLEVVVLLGSDVAFVLRGIGTDIGGIHAQIAALMRLDFRGFRAISDAMKEDAERARKELDAFQKRIVDPIVLNPSDSQDALSRRLGAQSRGRVLNYRAPGSGGPKDKKTEVERYIEQLQRQLEKTQGLTAVEQALLDIQKGRLGAATEAQKGVILDLAKQLDLTRELAKEQKERMEDGRKRAIAEGDAVNKSNQEYQDRLKTLLDGGPQAQLEKQRESMLLLADAFEKGRISAEQFNDAATGFLGLDQKAEKTKSIAEELGLTFSSAFEDAIVGGKGLSDVLKGLEQDILRIMTRKLVTEPLANFLTDSIGSFFGGARAHGGPVTAGTTYLVGERGPELFTASASGSIVPNHQLERVAAAGGNTTVVQVNVTAPQGTSRSSATQWGSEAARQMQHALSRVGG